MKNNKGFSLVELIIVIAIMAILVGVMAPQLIKYIEKTNVSADTQLCDSVKTAITTAMMDPSVITATNPGIPSNTTFAAMNSTNLGTGEFKCALDEILGFDATTCGSKIKSAHGSGAQVQFAIVNSNSVHVKITETDNTGKKDTSASTAANDIYVD